MPFSEIELYLPYIIGIAALWFLIFVITEVRKWCMARRRRQALKIAFGLSSAPQAQDRESRVQNVKVKTFPSQPLTLNSQLSPAIGRLEPIPAERRQKWEEARELARAGGNIDQIARHLSIGRDETKIALQAHPSPENVENPSVSPPERPAQVRRLAEEGTSPEEIGRRLSMSIQEVQLILRLL